jgi:hypothetical protein
MQIMLKVGWIKSLTNGMLEIDSDAVAGIDLDSGCCHWRGCDDHHRVIDLGARTRVCRRTTLGVAATDSNGVAVINWVVERQDFLVLISACVAVGTCAF